MKIYQDLGAKLGGKMKIIIIAILSLVCIFFGLKFYTKYKKRKNFFDALVYLCQKFDVEINFSRQRVQNIILSLDEKIKQNLCGLDKNFLQCLENKESLEKQKLFENLSFLNEDEQNNIFLFFKSLGRSDMENQLKEIKNFEKKFEDFLSTASLEFKKYGKLSLKLGFVACLLVVVIFI